jgi:hypothetical protein
MEVREPVAETRSQVQQGRRGRVRHPRVAIGSPGRDTLEQGQDRPHLRHRIQRGDEVDLRRTRVREARRDARVDERANQYLGTIGHQLRRHRISCAERPGPGVTEQTSLLPDLMERRTPDRVTGGRYTEPTLITSAFLYSSGR